MLEEEAVLQVVLRQVSRLLGQSSPRLVVHLLPLVSQPQELLHPLVPSLLASVRF